MPGRWKRRMLRKLGRSWVRRSLIVVGRILGLSTYSSRSLRRITRPLLFGEETVANRPGRGLARSNFQMNGGVGRLLDADAGLAVFDNEVVVGGAARIASQEAACALPGTRGEFLQIDD